MFKERGLMNNATEWFDTMAEACATDMPPAIRRLFATIVAYCEVEDKEGRTGIVVLINVFASSALFENFAEFMYDRGGGSEEVKRARALRHIEICLESNSLSLNTLGLPSVSL